MPHTTRKRNAPTHRKTQQITSEDGWTRVVTTERNRYTNTATANRQGTTRGGDECNGNGDGRDLGATTGGGGMQVQDPSLSVEKLREEFGKLMGLWVKSECRRAVRDVVVGKAAELALGGAGGVVGVAGEEDEGKGKEEGQRKGQLKRAIALALGSLSRLFRSRRDSMWQLVLFVDLVSFGTFCFYLFDVYGWPMRCCVA